MLSKENLNALLGLEIKAGAPQVLIYSPKTSERLRYVSGFIFEHVLKIKFKIITDEGGFSGHQGWKINYSSREMDGCLQIIPHDLVFETGVSKVRPTPILKNDLIYFFENNRGFHFDIFSAVFYFISRYEEWQPFKADIHERFEATESVLFTHKLHLKPVVDLWIMELKTEFEKIFPQVKWPERKFRIISTLDIDNLFAYKFKGVMRTVGASARDMLKLDLKNLADRLLVIAGKKKDPFDIYQEISDFCFDKQVPLICFFLFKTGTRHDRTVNPQKKVFAQVFEILRGNHALIGLHPSYEAGYKIEEMRNQLKELSGKAAQNINFSRQHYLRMNIKTTPNLLMKSGIIADFSMGFATEPGFRAGTSFPFYYFDLAAEKQTELLMVPFCAMDGAYTVYGKMDPEKSYNSLIELGKEVRKVQGLYITIFHERTFSDHLYKGFGSLYKKLILSLKDEG